MPQHYKHSRLKRGVNLQYCFCLGSWCEKKTIVLMPSGQLLYRAMHHESEADADGTCSIGVAMNVGTMHSTG